MLKEHREELISLREYEMDQYMACLGVAKKGFETDDNNILQIGNALQNAQKHLHNAAEYAKKLRYLRVK